MTNDLSWLDAIPPENSREFSMPILFARQLDKLQASKNKGRGIICVQAIISSLKKGDVAEAKRIYSWDGDKIQSYPDVKELIESYLGCRTHGVKNCRKCKEYGW